MHPIRTVGIVSKPKIQSAPEIVSNLLDWLRDRHVNYRCDQQTATYAGLDEFYPREEVPDESFTIPLGKADVKRIGRDVTVVATGMMVPLAMKVAETLQTRAIDVEVVDLRSIVPLDKEAVLRSVVKTGRLVTASETWAAGDSMAEVAATVAEHLCGTHAVPIARVGLTQVPRPFALTLERMVVPNEEKLTAAIQNVMNQSSGRT